MSKNPEGKNMNIIEDIGKGLKVNEHWTGRPKENDDNKDMDTWVKKEAEEWLEDNDFNTDNYEKMTNWHSFRQEDPDKYDDMRTETSPFDFDEENGVHVIYGIIEKDDDDYVEVQSVRFYHGEGEE